MMKRVKNLNREEKISFLNAIQKGDIAPDEATPETIICSDPTDIFGAIQAKTLGENVLFINEAKTSVTQSEQAISEKRKNF